MELLLNGAWTTLLITLTAVVCGLSFAVVLAFIRVVEVPVLNTIAKIYINTFRSLPLVMVLLGFYLAVPSLIQSTFNISGDVRLMSALIAFSLFEAAYFAEIIRSGVNSVAKGQVHASLAMGFTTVQAYRHIIIPQAIRNSFPVILTQIIILFQDTSLVYVIGLTDFFGSALKLGDIHSNKTQMLLVACLGYLVICVIMQRVANRLQSVKS